MLQPWALIVRLFTAPVAGPGGVGIPGGGQQLAQGAGEEPAETSLGGMGGHVAPFWAGEDDPYPWVAEPCPTGVMGLSWPRVESTFGEIRLVQSGFDCLIGALGAADQTVSVCYVRFVTWLGLTVRQALIEAGLAIRGLGRLFDGPSLPSHPDQLAERGPDLQSGIRVGSWQVA